MVITNSVCWYGHVLKWEDGYHQQCLLVWSCVEVGGWLSANSVCWYGHVLKWEDGYHQQCLLVWSCVEVGGWLSPTMFVGMVMC